jgi:hypothetical protein
VLSEAPVNALAESESTILNYRGVWELVEEVECTGEVDQSI